MKRDSTSWMVLLLLIVLSWDYHFAEGRISSKKPNMKEIDRMLKVMNKPAIKTIESVDGDIIDCVDIYKQPAFDHPLLRNHTIQMRPHSYLKGFEPAKNAVKSKLHQLWHLNGTCPEGTIPIRRLRRSDLIRAATLKNFRRKSPPGPVGGHRPSETILDGHEHAIIKVTEKFYSGAMASFNVWKPRLGWPNDFSLSQMWFTSGGAESTVEVGWMVFPYLFNDDLPRVFTYWTGDRYVSTGCYNLECSGFIQTSREVALGAALQFSVYEGEQAYMNVNVTQDQVSGYWYLEIGGEEIGHWPERIVPHLWNGAEEVHFGGEIYDHRSASNVPVPHTATEMGSGHFSREGLGRASYIGNIMVVDNDDSQTVEIPDRFDVVNSRPECYDLSLGRTTENGMLFFFGGPGFNENCR